MWKLEFITNIMKKEKRSREEIIAALKESAMLRSKWEAAIASGANREEMEKMGVKTIGVEEVC